MLINVTQVRQSDLRKAKILHYSGHPKPWEKKQRAHPAVQYQRTLWWKWVKKKCGKVEIKFDAESKPYVEKVKKSKN